MKAIEEHVNSLREYGVTVVENALSDELVGRCRENIIDYFSNKDNWCLGYNNTPQSLKSDGFNFEELKTCSEVIQSQKVLDVMRSLTNNHLRWTHHSDVHLNFPGAKEFHTDEQSRLWPEKTKNNISVADRDYRVYRLGTYLTEHTGEDGPPFYVKPGSYKTAYDNIMYSDAYEVNAEPGDVVIFHARTRHMGGNSRENRAALFWAFGEDNLHSIYHSMASIKRQLAQNFQTEYKLSKHMSDTFDKLDIAYDLDVELLNEFLLDAKEESITNEY